MEKWIQFISIWSHGRKAYAASSGCWLLFGHFLIVLTFLRPPSSLVSLYGSLGPCQLPLLQIRGQWNHNSHNGFLEILKAPQPTMLQMTNKYTCTTAKLAASCGPVNIRHVNLSNEKEEYKQILKVNIVRLKFFALFFYEIDQSKRKRWVAWGREAKNASRPS